MDKFFSVAYADTYYQITNKFIGQAEHLKMLLSN